MAAIVRQSGPRDAHCFYQLEAAEIARFDPGVFYIENTALS